MNSLRTQIVSCAVAVLALCTITACDVHEWPRDAYGDVEYEINLRFATQFPMYQEVIYTRANYPALDPERAEPIAAHDARYVVRAFPAGERAPDAAFRTFVFTGSSTEALDRTVSVSLPEGTWDLYVWTDFVDHGSIDDKYYTTGDFARISYADLDTYGGSNHCREAFRGTATIDITHPHRFMEDETLPAYSVTIDMQRPMGRFDFISTDVEEFVKQLGTLSSVSRADIDAKSLSRADLSEFRVVFRYNAFMPCTYNAFTDKPVDSWTGMSFESSLDVSDEGILLGFDHVLVNGQETVVNVSVEVYNGAGEMIASTPSIEVPVIRSKYTNVKGEFLTSKGSGGVSISPGFNGDYNIEI